MDNQVRVRLGFPSSSAHMGYRPTIEIDDAESGQPIVRIELTPEQFTTIMGSGQVTATGRYMPSPEMYAQRIGKTMEVRNVPVEEWPEGWTARKPTNTPDLYASEPTEEMHEFGDRIQHSEGYHEYSWSRHNYGWSLMLRRWVSV